MRHIKTSIIPFLIVIVIAFLMFDFGDGEIEYEHAYRLLDRFSI